MARKELIDLGARVRELRLSKKLTQEQVADSAELHVTYVSGIEGGRRNPSYLSLLAISRGLGVAVSELTKGIGA